MSGNLVTFVEGALGVSQLAGATNSAVATAGAGTIATNGLLISRTSPAGAITGVILESGTVDGQIVIVENDAIAANTVTFAAAGTSHVSNGVSTVIAGLTSVMYIWNATTALWYPVL